MYWFTCAGFGVALFFVWYWFIRSVNTVTADGSTYKGAKMLKPFLFFPIMSILLAFLLIYAGIKFDISLLFQSPAFLLCIAFGVLGWIFAFLPYANLARLGAFVGGFFGMIVFSYLAASWLVPVLNLPMW